jgi:Tfp pilus assembly protein PilO
MLTRQKTLAQNIGIFLSLVALLIVHGWFWGSWLRGANEKQTQLTKDLANLKREVEEKRQDTAKLKQEVEQTQSKLDALRKDLESLGNFLPSVKAKPQIFKAIMDEIEREGIRKEKTDFPPPEAGSGGGYVTVNFTLELVGPYGAFLVLLSKIQQTEMIIRISQFDVKDTGRESQTYDWRVVIQFQTYFEA